MSECKAYRREIDETADGRPVSAGLSAHAALCRACGDEMRVRKSLKTLVGGLGKVEAPADFEFRLRARMAAAKSDRGHGRFSGTRWLYGFAPVAIAACFVVVSATLYFRQSVRTNPVTAPVAVIASAPAPNVEPDRAPVINAQVNSTESAVPVRTTEVASVKNQKSQRELSPRSRQVREIAFKGLRRADVTSGTLISSVTGAPILMPIKASAEPLRVIVRDESGAERVVPMRSVSFGSQEVLARGAAGRPAVAVETGGVW